MKTGDYHFIPCLCRAKLRKNRCKELIAEGKSVFVEEDSLVNSGVETKFSTLLERSSDFSVSSSPSSFLFKDGYSLPASSLGALSTMGTARLQHAKANGEKLHDTKDGDGQGGDTDYSSELDFDLDEVKIQSGVLNIVCLDDNATRRIRNVNGRLLFGKNFEYMQTEVHGTADTRWAQKPPHQGFVNYPKLSS